MTLDEYQKNKTAKRLNEWQPRKVCWNCRRSLSICFCSQLKPYASTPRFAILIQRDEAKRTIATGRMAHLSLSNSFLIAGTDFSFHAQLNQILADECFYPVVLYPGPTSTNLSPLTWNERTAFFPKNREPLFLVIDGTWGTSRRMMRLSQNLHSLPRFCFTPPKASRFRVRKQPKAGFYSTIESIHQVIDLMTEPKTSKLTRPQDHLLTLFETMNEQQLKFGGDRLARRGVRKRD